MEKDWKLDIVFSDSVAIFRGHVGPNKPHSHWASQLTIALDGELEFEAGDAGRRHARALFLSSNVKHQLYSGYVCSIYFDPLARSSLTALGEGRDAGWAALTAAELPAPLRQLSADSDLRALLESDLLTVTPPDTAEEGRFRDIVNVITAQLRAGNDPDREVLAAQARLSPSRFSHWFVEQSGIPLRSYKKWLKLRMAMDALLDGVNPMEAAMQAGFSDLPHMSRAFAESFGLTYMDALHALQQAQHQ
ncbi:helix-turn-helix domain-containing protein [Alcanivorax sp. DP30]|uniref:helix-turn-helix transcriptional regulator n=1 Tax=Alcanivorax sp. DP30 TaxID=2606217 RepID=UPI0013707BDE|nr:helix-turn-helix domain-containing protein [Alcanivorax sp. DP30]MZR63252.1 helix-turn-helix domain-containing protein [Alcanivorax sp. DP30]